MVALLAALASPASASLGPDWKEPIDAGNLPILAQFVLPPPGTFVASGLSTIAGELGRPLLFGGEEPGDEQDMYWIVITDPVRILFSAGTSIAFEGSATFDTQLWLFDRDGFGLLASNDVTRDDFGSGFFDSSTDRSGVVLTEPGTYLIAVSGIGSEPVDFRGSLLFDFDDDIEVSGPDGQGGGNPIAGWSNRDDAPSDSPLTMRSYTIAFEGAMTLTPGDLDASGSIDGADLGLMLSSWGPCSRPAACPADLDGDGVISGADLGVLLANWT